MMRKRKDYGLSKLTIGQYPELGLIPDGIYAGSPCIIIKCGDEVEITNEKLRDVINSEFPLTHHILFTDEDPMLFANELWSFVKYYKKTSDKDRKFHIFTSGHKYIVKFLYEIDNIIIDVKTPSSTMETPSEFISWSAEDPYLKKKVEYVFIVNCDKEDINFTRYEGVKIGTYRRPITIRQGTGWKSYEHFCDEFIPTSRYPYVRIITDFNNLCVVK